MKTKFVLRMEKFKPWVHSFESVYFRVIKYAEFIGVIEFLAKSTVLEISACGFIGAPPPWERLSKTIRNIQISPTPLNLECFIASLCKICSFFKSSKSSLIVVRDL